jgi:hypothetical protein
MLKEVSLWEAGLLCQDFYLSNLKSITGSFRRILTKGSDMTLEKKRRGGSFVPTCS